MEGKVENKNITYNVANVPLNGSPVREKNTRNDFQMNVVSSDSEEYMTRNMSPNGRPGVNLNKRNGQVDDLNRVVDLQNLDEDTIDQYINMIKAACGDDGFGPDFEKADKDEFNGEKGFCRHLAIKEALVLAYAYNIFSHSNTNLIRVKTLLAAGFIAVGHTCPGRESEVLNNIKNKAANFNQIKDEVEDLLKDGKITLLCDAMIDIFQLNENTEEKLCHTFRLREPEVRRRFRAIGEISQRLSVRKYGNEEDDLFKKAKKIGVFSPISVENLPSNDDDEDYQSDGNEDEQNRFNSDDDVAQDRYYPKNRVENRFNDRYNDTESHQRSHGQNYHKNKAEHGRTLSKSSSDIDPNSNTGVMTTANEECKNLQESYRPNKNENVSSAVKKGVGAAIMAQVLCKEYSENFKMFECVGNGGSVGRIDSIIVSLQSYTDSNDRYVSSGCKAIIENSQKNRGKLKNVSEKQLINACIVGDAQRLINYVNSKKGFDSNCLSIEECKLTSKSEKSLDQISSFLEEETKKVLSIIDESEKSFDSKKKGSFYKMVSCTYFGNNGNKAAPAPQQPQRREGIFGMMNRSDGESTPDTHKQSGTNNVRSNNHHQSKPTNTHPAPQSKVQRVANGKPSSASNRGTPDARRQPNSNNVRNNNDSHNHHQSKPLNAPKPAPQQPQRREGIFGMMNR